LFGINTRRHRREGSDHGAGSGHEVKRYRAGRTAFRSFATQAQDNGLSFAATFIRGTRVSRWLRSKLLLIYLERKGSRFVEEVSDLNRAVRCLHRGRDGHFREYARKNSKEADYDDVSESETAPDASQDSGGLTPVGSTATAGGRFSEWRARTASIPVIKRIFLPLATPIRSLWFALARATLTLLAGQRRLADRFAGARNQRRMDHLRDITSIVGHTSRTVSGDRFALSPTELPIALLVMVLAWGRGRFALTQPEESFVVEKTMQQNPTDAARNITRIAEHLGELSRGAPWSMIRSVRPITDKAESLLEDEARSPTEVRKRQDGLMALAAEAFSIQHDHPEIVEMLCLLDEATYSNRPRTRRQEELIDIFSERTGIGLVPADRNP